MISKTVVFVGLTLALASSAVQSKRILNKERYDITDVSGLGITEEYKMLDEELVEKVQDANPQANIQAAMQIFNQKHAEEVPETYAIMRALRLFQSLALVNEKTMCSYDSYNILWHNSKAAQVHADQGSETRTGQVVRAIMEQHAAACRDVYPVKLETRFRAPLRNHELENTNYLYQRIKNAWLQSGQSQEQPEKADYYLGSSNVMKQIVLTQPQLIHEHVKMFEGETVKSLYWSERHEVLVKAYEEHLFEPCEYFLEHFKDIFEPASFDEIVGEGVPAENSVFYREMSRYDLCKLVMKESPTILENASELVVRWKNAGY